MILFFMSKWRRKKMMQVCWNLSWLLPNDKLYSTGSGGRRGYFMKTGGEKQRKAALILFLSVILGRGSFKIRCCAEAWLLRKAIWIEMCDIDWKNGKLDSHKDFLFFTHNALCESYRSTKTKVLSLKMCSTESSEGSCWRPSAKCFFCCHFSVACSCFPVLWHPSRMWPCEHNVWQPDTAGHWFPSRGWKSRGRSRDPGPVFGHKITNRKLLQSGHTAPLPPFVYQEIELKSNTRLSRRLLLQPHSTSAVGVRMPPPPFTSVCWSTK